jgi:hypothetical protein
LSLSYFCSWTWTYSCAFYRCPIAAFVPLEALEPLVALVAPEPLEPLEPLVALVALEPLAPFYYWVYSHFSEGRVQIRK